MSSLNFISSSAFVYYCVFVLGSECHHPKEIYAAEEPLCQVLIYLTMGNVKDGESCRKRAEEN